MLAAEKKLTVKALQHNLATDLDIDKMHVPLALVERKKQEKKPNEEISAERGSRLYEPAYEEKQRFEHEQFLRDVLEKGTGKSQGKRIAIIGEPGAGKSTLLRKIAFWLSETTEDLPVLISLADLPAVTSKQEFLEEYLLSKWLKAALAHLPELVEVTEALKTAFKQLCKQGRVWLLLDAVDEMPVGGEPLSAMASQLRGWIAPARVVLTCRLNVWDANRNVLADTFEIYRSLQFSYGDGETGDQVGQFIAKWFKDKPELGQKLRRALDEPGKERIKDLAKNPLRLALLCGTWSLWQDHGGLPDTRAKLYKGFVENFYELKQDKFPITPNQRRDLNRKLGEFAKWAIDQKDSRFRLKHSWVCRFLGQPGEELYELAVTKLAWLNKVGLAAESPDEAVYAFYHTTFQEYFAALAIDDWRFFLNHQDPPLPPLKKGGLNAPLSKESGGDLTYRIFAAQWKQVILLWLGRQDVAKEQERKEAFIKALVEFKDGCGKFSGMEQIGRGFYEYRAYFLAAAGIAEFKDCSRSQEIVDSIVKWGFGDFLYPIQEGAKAALLETDRNRAIGALVRVIESTHNELSRWQAAESLGKIDTDSETAIRELVRLIESAQHEYTRRLAADSLGEIGTGSETAIRELVRVIESAQDENTRRKAAESLGKIGTGSETAIRALVRVIESAQDENTRWLAAESLGKIGSGSETAIRELVRVIESAQDENTRSKAAESLGQIGTDSETAIQGLVRVIESAQDENTRSKAAESLGQIGTGSETAIQGLVRVIESAPDEYTRRLAAVSLGKIGTGNKTAIEALEGLIESTQDKFTRMLAAVSLGQIDPCNQTAIRELERLIESEQDEYTRMQAAAILGQIDPGNQTAIRELVRLIESAQHENTRMQAAVSLGQIDPGNQTAIRELERLIESAQDEFTCMGSAVILGQIGSGSETAIQGVVRVIKSAQHENTRWLAAGILGQIGTGSETAIRGLVLVIDSAQDENTRRKAAESLGKIGSRSETAIRTLVRLIESAQDEYTRWHAAESLRQIGTGSETAIRELVRVIESAQDEFTRMQAAESLGQIGSGSETAIRALVRLIKSTQEGDTRRIAAESLRKILGDNQFAEVVTSLKDELSFKSYKKNSWRFEECYKVISHCAQTMPYPEFYQAWHNRPSILNRLTRWWHR